jgi:ethanolamine ammonia-lyase large subunit
MNRGAPVDLVFQSVAGTQAANVGFGVGVGTGLDGLLVDAVMGARGQGRALAGLEIHRVLPAPTASRS